MLQCTWFAYAGQDNGFFLGASLGGADYADTGQWRTVLGWTRYGLIQPMLPVTEHGAMRFGFLSSVRRAEEEGYALEVLRVLQEVRPLLGENGTNLDQGRHSQIRHIFANTQACFRRVYGARNRNVPSLEYWWNQESEQVNQQAIDQSRVAVTALLPAVQDFENPAARFGNCAETYPFINLFQ